VTDYALRLSEAELNRYRVMAEHARAAEADLWQLAGIVAGAVVADIGCGPGAILPALSEAVGPGGVVHALDADADARAAARTLIEAAGLSNTDVREGRAEDTGFEVSSFDAVMMRHVLAHNGRQEQAIVDHLAGLVRPGGAVYLLDIDGPGLRTRNADPDLADLNDKYAQFHALRGNDLQVGLRLDALLETAGLQVIGYRGWYTIITPPPGLRGPAWAGRDAMLAAGVATAEDVARWSAAFDRSEATANAPRMKLFAPMFAAVGRRPV
jgi:SAM-dependent methyltransferase